ncbi:Transcription antiterminator LicT [Pragia fontium]|uniref:Transcription antiterminator LicT n=1 Tax=Pragia fontium TaxID=82985 RepID=A0ABQ5LJK3_9GAMM|nr:PRD domain-containing protein [Pragia fontium]GKX63569.1 transcription antiterminator LicT [Pragia fontium]SUB83491.1 Transcription antiterminator LicT [Pragia fontium]
MNIDKILNNNVVIVSDENGDELVVMGRGLGFKKKAGDALDKTLIEKVFSVKNQEITSHLEKLLAEIPAEIMTTSEKIIRYAQQNLPTELHSSIYISLTDHINFAIERHKKGLDIKNGLLWETKRLYPKEFAIGLEALNIIEKRLNVKLPEDEAGFITLHIINAQLNDDISNVINMTKIMQEIMQIVKYHFNLDYNEQALSYHRFVTHLKFFAQRMMNNNYVSSEDESLHDVIKDKYVKSYICTQKISQHLKKHYQHELTKEEMLFLTIHIERVRSEANS